MLVSFIFSQLLSKNYILKLYKSHSMRPQHANEFHQSVLRICLSICNNQEENLLSAIVYNSLSYMQFQDGLICTLAYVIMQLPHHVRVPLAKLTVCSLHIPMKTEHHLPSDHCICNSDSMNPSLKITPCLNVLL